MQILLIIVAVCFAGFLYKNPEAWKIRSASAFTTTARPTARTVSHSVDMYALTTCEHCMIMEAQMTAAGIPFKKYDIDADQSRMNELNQRLVTVGHAPGGAVPVIFAGNQIFYGEVPINAIRAAIQ